MGQGKNSHQWENGSLLRSTLLMVSLLLYDSSYQIVDCMNHNIGIGLGVTWSGKWYKLHTCTICIFYIIYVVACITMHKTFLMPLWVLSALYGSNSDKALQKSYVAVTSVLLPSIRSWIKASNIWWCCSKSLFRAYVGVLDLSQSCYFIRPRVYNFSSGKGCIPIGVIICQWWEQIEPEPQWYFFPVFSD